MLFLHSWQKSKKLLVKSEVNAYVDEWKLRVRTLLKAIANLSYILLYEGKHFTCWATIFLQLHVFTYACTFLLMHANWFTFSAFDVHDTSGWKNIIIYLTKNSNNINWTSFSSYVAAGIFNDYLMTLLLMMVTSPGY